MESHTLWQEAGATVLLGMMRSKVLCAFAALFGQWRVSAVCSWPANGQRTVSIPIELIDKNDRTETIV